jgi:hypothetical protein
VLEEKTHETEFKARWVPLLPRESAKKTFNVGDRSSPERHALRGAHLLLQTRTRVTQPDMSEKLLQRKLANIEKTGVNIVASANPGCSVQLEAGARFSNKNLKIVHPISLLAQAYRSAAQERVGQG